MQNTPITSSPNSLRFFPTQKMADKAPESDLTIDQAEFLKDSLLGLSRALKSLPFKYLFDQRGSELFELICDQEEYTLVKNEVDLLKDHLPTLLAEITADPLSVIEMGNILPRRSSLLLKYLPHHSSYFLMDLSKRPVNEQMNSLQSDFPPLSIQSVIGDFTHMEDLMRLQQLFDPHSKRLIFLPGSIIGNFTPTEAQRLLTRFHELVGPGGSLLVGVDLLKDAATLERAYNDQAGLMAELNLNILKRLNSDLRADFPVHYFRYQAFFNAKQSRIEMHLVCDRSCIVRLNGFPVRFTQGESIQTASAQKYTRERFQKLARQSGFEPRRVRTDDKDYFAVFLLEAD